MEREIIGILKERGPLTGGEIKESLQCDGLTLWRTCKTSSVFSMRGIGTRYLRLDRRVEGLARLSPSLYREFLTYCVIGLRDESDWVEKKAQALTSRIEWVSRTKLELIFDVVLGLTGRLEHEWPSGHQVCFIIAGDIVYNMAHDVARPERSTGRLVNGSDMDLVVITDDLFPEHLVARLDDAIYQEKYRLLMTPHIREEIDYVVKRMGKVEEQVRFDTFKHMVACKILQEGTFLHGSEALFQTVKGLLRDFGVTQKLADMEREAQDFRREAETYLLTADPAKIREQSLYLFYPTEESEEFE